MVKNSTLMYLYSNFDESEIISNNFDEYSLNEFDEILNFIEEKAKKIPDRIVDNVFEFAKNYS